ncbi:MAG: hypothetical protein IKU34_06990 [Clostridia bacterium]|nr:hypothetical protein [Clostridia bacterium]
MGGMLKMAIRGLCELARHELQKEVDPERLEEIIMLHAIGAAVSAMASGWIPGAGGVVAMGIGVTFVCSMYIRLGNVLGITFSKGMIRAVASAVVADLASYVATLLAISAAVSFIPFVGSMSASTLTALANFACVYLAAIIFIKMLGALMRTGKDVGGMSEDELITAIKREKDNVDIDRAMAEAKKQFKKAEASGDLKKPGFTPGD